MNRNSHFNKLYNQGRKKNIGLLQKLYLLQVRGNLQLHNNAQPLKLFHRFPRRLVFRLRDLVSEEILQSGHVFLGFTKDGQFVVSYTLQMEWSNVREIPDCQYIYKLHWWKFVPYGPLIKTSDVLLFGDQVISKDLNIAFCEWPNDDTKVLIYGCCYSSSQDMVECYMTITSYPSLIPCRTCKELRNANIANAENDSLLDNSFSSVSDAYLKKRCLRHCFIVHTNYQVVRPFPQFNPGFCMKRDGMVVINTGDSIHILQVSAKNKDPPEPENQESSLKTCKNFELYLPGPSVSDAISEKDGDSPECATQRTWSVGSCCGQHEIGGMRDSGGLPAENVLEVLDDASPTCNAHSHKNCNGFLSSSDLVSSKVCHIFCDACVRLNNRQLNVESKNTLGPYRKGCECNRHSIQEDTCFLTSPVSNIAAKIAPHKLKGSVEISSNMPYVKSAAGQDSKVSYLSNSADKASTSSLLNHTKLGDHSHSISSQSDTSHDLSNPCQTLQGNSRVTLWLCDKKDADKEDLCLSCKSSAQATDSHHFGQINTDLNYPTNHRIHCHNTLSVKCDAVPALTEKPLQNVKPNLLLQERTFLCSEEKESLKENISPKGIKVVSPNLALNSSIIKGYELQSHCICCGEQIGENCATDSLFEDVCFRLENGQMPAQRLMFVKEMQHCFTEMSANHEDPFFDNTDEDSNCLEYHKSLAFEVHGTSYRLMKASKKDAPEKMKEAAVVIRQLTFDIELYVYEIAQKLSIEAGQKCLAINDYDAQLVDLCPSSGSLLILVHVLLQTTFVKSKKGKITKVPVYERHMFHTGFTFEWNIDSGTCQLIDTKDLEEVNPWDKMNKRYSRLWNPAKQAAHLLQKKWYLRQSFARSVNSLTNNAVFKGVSLGAIWAPAQNVVIML